MNINLSFIMQKFFTMLSDSMLLLFISLDVSRIGSVRVLDKTPNNPQDTSVAPYHALVFYKRLFCSGSMIASKIVLTVASCFDVTSNIEAIYVKIGCVDILEDAGQIFSVVEKKQHEFYKYRSEFDNDIALLVLEKQPKFDGRINKILLSRPDFPYRAISQIVVTGWGRNDSVKTQDKKIIRSYMMLLRRRECIEAYDDLVTPSMFCAKHDRGNLLNDNGGAAVYRDFAVGLASYYNPQKPSVTLFTNVSYFFRWIKLNSIRLLTKYCDTSEDAEKMGSQSDYFELNEELQAKIQQLYL